MDLKGLSISLDKEGDQLRVNTFRHISDSSARGVRTNLLFSIRTILGLSEISVLVMLSSYLTFDADLSHLAYNLVW